MLIRLIGLAAISVAAIGSVNVQRNDGNDQTAHQDEDSKLMLAFVMFRHGDRTPNEKELETFPSANINESIFFPYGIKALTNEGKMRGYHVGEHLRKRYKGLLSELYLPEEISVLSAHSARCKMTALTALAAMYPPNYLQKWNKVLDWQPIPYKSHSKKHDELHVPRSCEVFKSLKKQVYKLPEIMEKIDKYRYFFGELSSKTGHQFEKPKHVARFNNLIHGLENVKMKLPDWVNETKPTLQEVTNLDFECSFYTDQLKRLGGGVFVYNFIHASMELMTGNQTANVQLLVGHETSVAGFMAASTVFTKPEQPGYGATFSLELRRVKATNDVGVMATYLPSPGEPLKVLPIPNCGGTDICNFNTFMKITEEYALSREQYFIECGTSRTIKT